MPGWKWSTTDYNECRGIFGISSLHAYSGNRSLLMNFLPFTYNLQTDLYPAVNDNFGNDVWIEMWIYPAYEEGRYSRFDIINKWVYLYGSVSPAHWIFRLGTKRFTGTKSWDNVDPLPNDHTGLFLNFDDESCNCPPSGQNLGDNNDYIPMNKWSRLIIHSDTSTNTYTHEAWINTGAGLKKVAEHIISGCSPMDIVRIKLGTTFPGLGQSTNYLDSWIFVDDVKIATSRDDIDWETQPDTTQPAAPTGVIAQ